MTNIGSAFSKSSAPIKYRTNGCLGNEIKIVSNPDLSKISLSDTKEIGNNISTYSNGETITYTQTVNGDWCYVYFNFPQNRNVQGSIIGDASISVNTNKNVNGEEIFQKGAKLNFGTLTTVGTKNTRGYRTAYAYYTPYISNRPNENLDGTESKRSAYISSLRYDAYQGFYNEEDPYGILSVKITNNDNPNSTSKKFVTLKKNDVVVNDNTYTNTKYTINPSYTYNPYNNNAGLLDSFSFDITYNELPTYPKEFVLTYSDNYNSFSPNGGNLYIEAKAKLDGTYQGFTTTTATDTGFTSYDRTAILTYEFKTYHSSNQISKFGTRTFKQNAKPLTIAYQWSVEGNPNWIKFTNGTNNASFTISDNSATKGKVSGTMTVDCERTLKSGEIKTGKIGGIVWIDSKNTQKRTATIVSKLNIENCSAQNIYPIDSSDNKPTKRIEISQNGQKYNSPGFSIPVSIVGNISNETDIYPTINIGDTTLNANTKQSIISCTYGAELPISIEAPIISSGDKQNPNTSGKIIIYSKTGNNNLGFLPEGNAISIKLSPNPLIFKKGYIKGHPKYEWLLQCHGTATDIDGNEDSNITLNGWGGTTPISINALESASYFSGSVKYTTSVSNDQFRLQSYDENHPLTDNIWKVSDNKGDETIVGSCNNDFTDISSNDKVFSIVAKPNVYKIGSWTTSSNDTTITVSSTTKNTKQIKGILDIKLSLGNGDTGTVNSSINDSTILNTKINLMQLGSNCTGKIRFTYKYAVKKLNYTQIDYPANISGNATYTCKDMIVLEDPDYSEVQNAGNVTPFLVYNNAITTSVSFSGGTYDLKIRGVPNIVDGSDADKIWEVHAISTVGDQNPLSGNPVASGIIPGKDAEYSLQYTIKDASATKDTAWGNFYDDRNNYIVIPPNKATLSSYTNAKIIIKMTDGSTRLKVNEGIYTFTPREEYYSGSKDITYIISVKVNDKHYADNQFISDNTATVIQSGEPSYGNRVSSSYTYDFKTAGLNCTVTTPTSIDLTNNMYEQTRVGKFDISSYSPILSPDSNQGSSRDLSSYIFNFKNDITKNEKITGNYYVGFTNPGDKVLTDTTVTYSFGTTTVGNYELTKRTYTTGSKSWNYSYRATIRSVLNVIDSGGNIMLTKNYSTISNTFVGNGNYYPSSSSILSKYYRMYKLTTPQKSSSSWTMMTNSIIKFNTLPNVFGEYRLEVRWAKSTDIMDLDNIGYKKISFKITKNNYQEKFEYYISSITLKIKEGDQTHDAFYDDLWVSSVIPQPVVKMVKSYTTDGKVWVENTYDAPEDTYVVTTKYICSSGTYTGTTTNIKFIRDQNNPGEQTMSVQFMSTVKINDGLPLYKKPGMLLTLQSMSSKAYDVTWTSLAKEYYNM